MLRLDNALCPSLISLMVSVDVKHHVYSLTYLDNAPQAKVHADCFIASLLSVSCLSHRTLYCNCALYSDVSLSNINILYIVSAVI